MRANYSRGNRTIGPRLAKGGHSDCRAGLTRASRSQAIPRFNRVVALVYPLVTLWVANRNQRSTMTNHGPVFSKYMVRRCCECPIRTQAFCASCDQLELQILERAKRYRHYRKGEVVAMSGHEMPFVASIVQGSAALTQHSEDGRVQMVGLLFPSDFVGNPEKPTAQHTVTALSDLHLCSFEKKKFNKLAIQIPHVLERMLQLKLDELDAAREWMMVVGRKTARERICSFLAMIAHRDARATCRVCEGTFEVDILLTRASLGDYLGLTMETVSRHLTALRDEGLIEFGVGRRLVIRDFQKLYNETGDDGDGGLVG